MAKKSIQATQLLNEDIAQLRDKVKQLQDTYKTFQKEIKANSKEIQEGQSNYAKIKETYDELISNRAQLFRQIENLKHELVKYEDDNIDSLEHQFGNNNEDYYENGFTQRNAQMNPQELNYIYESPSAAINSLKNELQRLKVKLFSREEEVPLQISNEKSQYVTVYFAGEFIKIRLPMHNDPNKPFTFEELSKVVAQYYGKPFDKCYLLDETYSIWPNQSRVLEEASSTSEDLKIILSVQQQAKKQSTEETKIDKADSSNKKNKQQNQNVQPLQDSDAPINKQQQFEPESESSGVSSYLLGLFLYSLFLTLLFLTLLDSQAMLENNKINTMIDDSFISHKFTFGIGDTATTLDQDTVHTNKQIFAWLFSSIYTNLDMPCYPSQYITCTDEGDVVNFNRSIFTLDNSSFPQTLYKPFLKKNNQIIGKIRLVQQRVKNDTCDFLPQFRQQVIQKEVKKNMGQIFNFYNPNEERSQDQILADYQEFQNQMVKNNVQKEMQWYNRIFGTYSQRMITLPVCWGQYTADTFSSDNYSQWQNYNSTCKYNAQNDVDYFNYTQIYKIGIQKYLNLANGSAIPIEQAIEDCQFVRGYTYTGIYQSYFQDWLSSRQIGKYGTYNNNNGYIVDLQPNRTLLHNALQFLFQNRWIDQQTRAIFVNFNSFNTISNHFTYVSLGFEIDRSGLISPLNYYHTFAMYNYGIIQSIKNNGFNILNIITSFELYLLLFSLIRIVYISYILYIRRDQQHFLVKINKFWYVFTVVVDLLVFFDLFYRIFMIYVIIPAIENIDKTQYENIMNQIFFISVRKYTQSTLLAVALLQSFQWIQLKQFDIIVVAFKRMARIIFIYFMIAAIIVIAFSICMQLLFGSFLKEFRDIGNTINTSFSMLLSKTPVLPQMIFLYPIIWPCLQIAYFFTMFFLTLRIFEIIVIEAFSSSRMLQEEAMQKLRKQDIFAQYMAQLWKEWKDFVVILERRITKAWQSFYRKYA